MKHAKIKTAVFWVVISFLLHSPSRAEIIAPGNAALASKGTADLVALVAMGAVRFTANYLKKDVEGLHIVSRNSTCDDSCVTALGRILDSASGVSTMSAVGIGLNSVSIALDLAATALVMYGNPAGPYVYHASFLGSFGSLVLSGFELASLNALQNSVTGIEIPQRIRDQFQNNLLPGVVSLFANGASFAVLVTHLYSSAMSAENAALREQNSLLQGMINAAAPGASIPVVVNTANRNPDRQGF